MNRKLGSVHINEVQGNLFPPDVNFRGDSVSPLLGTAQGLNPGSSYTPRQGRRYFARINNLLDRRYASAAPLGSNGFDRNGNFSARPFPANAEGDYPLRGSTFFAPGAPRGISVGMRYTFF